MRESRFGRIAAYALSRPEAYLIVGLVFVAIMVAIVGGWPVWIIPASLVAGALMLALLVLDSLSDPRAERDASVADVEPGRIHDRVLRGSVQRGLEYVRAAHRLAGGRSEGALETAGEELPQMERAVRSIYDMSLRLQEYRADQLLRRDLVDLQRQQGALTEEQQQHLDSLRRLDDLARTATEEIEGALAQLGQAYAEMQAIRVTPELRGRPAEALRRLGESSQRLADLAAGYDEAYGTRSSAGIRAQGG